MHKDKKAISIKDILRLDESGGVIMLRHYALDCVDHIRPLLVSPDSIEAIDVARKYAQGQADVGELMHANELARRYAVGKSDNAAWSAVRASSGGLNAETCFNVACGCVYAARWATCSGKFGPSWSANVADAQNDETHWQAERLRYLITAGEWSPVDDQVQP